MMRSSSNSALPIDPVASDLQSPQPLLEVVQLAKSYGKIPVLSEVSFELLRSETLVILGESGCGKTTLLRLLAGLQEPHSGNMRINGKPFAELPVRQRGIVYLDQEAMLFEHLNVFENVAFALRLANRPSSEVKSLVNEILSAVQLEEHANKRSWQISGGQKQRVAFARAILARPQVLLLDEPFCSLDSANRAAMQDLFKRLRAQYSITALFVTHDVKEALEVGDRFASMSQGRLRVYSNRKQFMEDESTGIPREIAFWKQCNAE